MKLLRLFCLLAVVVVVGCGPQVSGPGPEPASNPDAPVDEALEKTQTLQSE